MTAESWNCNKKYRKWK